MGWEKPRPTADWFCRFNDFCLYQL